MVLPGLDEATVRVCLNGEFDIGRSAELAEQMVYAVIAARGRLLIVDLAGVTFLDASAVDILQRTRMVANEIGADFVIANPGHPVRIVIDLLGDLSELMTPSFHAPN